MAKFKTITPDSIRGYLERYKGSGSAEIVLVTAHLDATSAASHDRGDYHPDRDPAPGADDDASGIAAVLAIADVIKQLAMDRYPPRPQPNPIPITTRSGIRLSILTMRLTLPDL